MSDWIVSVASPKNVTNAFSDLIDPEPCNEYVTDILGSKLFFSHRGKHEFVFPNDSRHDGSPLKLLLPVFYCKSSKFHIFAPHTLQCYGFTQTSMSRDPGGIPKVVISNGNLTGYSLANAAIRSPSGGMVPVYRD